MEVDKSNTANELAFLLVEECQKWTYSAYSNEGDVNDVARNPNIDRQYESRLDRAIADTQAKIQSQKRVLEDLLQKQHGEEEKLQSALPHLNPETKRLHDLAAEVVKLQAMTKAQNHFLYQVSLPSSDSPLNALLTRQNLESVNEETLETIRRVKGDVTDLSQRIIQEHALLNEVTEISDALKERLSSLRTKSQQTASEYLAEISHQKTKYTTQTSVLTKGVRLFIQNHLAEILYAETKGALPAEPNSLPKKKRRRDEDEEYERELGTRMSNLVEELMNRLVRRDGTSPWVDVVEDDVIVRCLVRANIAIMHPNDGSKIRLVEFHKEVESEAMEED